MYDYGYGYTEGYVDYNAGAGMLGGMAAFLGVIYIISMAIVVISIISQWKIYKKAGKKGWECLIPVYNIIVLLDIVKLPTWYIALFFVPFANIYAMFKIYIELAHKFGKSTGFGVATVFFNFICFPILAFGKNNVYQDGSNNNQPNLNFTNSEIPTPPQGNNMNYNNSNVQEPMLFNQNINTNINPIPQVQNNDINMGSPVNTVPQPETQQPVAFNPMNSTIPTPISSPEINNNVQSTPVSPITTPQPVSFNPNPVPEQTIVNPVPTTTNIQPVNDVQQQGLNAIPNQGPIPVPQMPNQNPGNNQNNPNM